MQLLSSGVLLAICAGSLESFNVIQAGPRAQANSRPARIGAWIGLLAIVVVRRAHERKIVVSYNEPDCFAECDGKTRNEELETR